MTIFDRRVLKIKPQVIYLLERKTNVVMKNGEHPEQLSVTYSLSFHLQTIGASTLHLCSRIGVHFDIWCQNMNLQRIWRARRTRNVDRLRNVLNEAMRKNRAPLSAPKRRTSIHLYSNVRARTYNNSNDHISLYCFTTCAFIHSFILKFITVFMTIVRKVTNW